VRNAPAMLRQKKRACDALRSVPYWSTLLIAAAIVEQQGQSFPLDGCNQHHHASLAPTFRPDQPASALVTTAVA
jgi:hypothetical protein